MKPTKLRLTGRQHETLQRHLFPGDGKEAMAICLCGRRRGDEEILCVRSVHPVPYDECKVRTATEVVWSTDSLPDLLVEAQKRDLAVVKVHCHPGGFDRFSTRDDRSDHDVFNSVYGWVDGPGPHASVVMLPNGRMFGRVVAPDGAFAPLVSIAVAGDDFRIWFHDQETVDHATQVDATLRHAQLFGEGTTRLLRRISIAIVGASGSGSPTFEQAYRLQVGRIVLVDPDPIEEKNLNRIINATAADIGRPKVEVLAEAAERSGLGVDVVPIAKLISDASAVRAVAGCDVVFGCVDTAEGRHILSRLCAFYSIPYIDLAVQIEADGEGGIDQIYGAVHYVQPDGSSLLGRGAYTMDDVRADELRRTDPERYQELLDAGYIRGAQVESPAVIHLNMMISSFGMNELLARLHPFRFADNSEFWVTRVSLTGAIIAEDEKPEPPPCSVIAKHCGRGDVKPLLGMPEIEEDEL